MSDFASLYRKHGGWTFPQTVSAVVGGTTLLQAPTMFRNTFMDLQHRGFDFNENFAISLALPAATVLAVSLASGHLAEKARANVASRYSNVSNHVRASMLSVREFFDREGISYAHRRAVTTRNAIFEEAMASSLGLAGVEHFVVRDESRATFYGDVRKVAPLVDRILSLPDFQGLDTTLVSVRPHGEDAPTAVRRLADKTSVALWADKFGEPTRTVGYAADGSPAWLREFPDAALDRSDDKLFEEPMLDVALFDMSEASMRAATAYGDLRTRMTNALNSDTHTMSEREGFLFVRDRNGRLDNADGAPSMLSPEGEATWTRAGRKLKVEAPSIDGTEGQLQTMQAVGPSFA